MSGGVFLKPPSQTSLGVSGVFPPLRQERGGPRPVQGGGGACGGPPLMANSCRSPHRLSSQAEAQPGRTLGRLPAAWGLALARPRRRAKEDRRGGRWRGRDRKEDGDMGEEQRGGSDGAKGHGGTDGRWGWGREAGTGSKMRTGQRHGDRNTQKSGKFGHS